jgi:hypothetical protein
MSAPAENIRPALVITIALTFASASARSMPAATAVRVSWPSPLTGGLSSVMTATASSTR